MSTYLEYVDAKVSLKPEVSVEGFEDAILDQFADFGVRQNKDGTVTILGGSDVRFCWEDDLRGLLEEFCESWDVEAQEEMCAPLRFYKEKGGEAAVVSGTELVYYPGFEKEFVKELSPVVIREVFNQYQK